MHMSPEKRILLAVALVLSFLVTGTVGYIIIDDYTVLDAFYMTVITITTVGYGEVKTLSEVGRVFTIFLILFSVGSIALLAGAFSELLIERAANPMRWKKTMEKRINRLSGHIIICGHGRVGEAAADYFLRNNKPFVVIENQDDSVRNLQELGYCFIKGDGTREESLLMANIKNASAVLAVMGSDPENLFAVLTARELNPVLKIIARTESSSSESRLLRAGADSVISPFVTAGNKVAKSLMGISPTEGSDNTFVSSDDVVPKWFSITKGSDLEGRSVEEVALQLEGTVVGLRRGDVDYLLPKSAFKVKLDDQVFVLSTGTITREVQPILSPKRIVLIDDNPVIITLYTRLFQKAGFQIKSASTGDEGYELVMGEKPDVAVIDYHLPDMSGTEVCRKIRENEIRKDIKIFLFTADEQESTKLSALEAGADGVVVKSPNATEIVDQVIKYLG